MPGLIDVSYDFRTDSNGKDPDSYSPTLRSYHKLLWSKKLPCDGEMVLDDKLINKNSLGHFRLSSDSIIHTFSYWEAYKDIIRQIPEKDIEFFRYKSYTIGGMLVFPAERIDKKPTINGARGMHPFIKDRIDLTLECIRLFYAGKENPLYNCLDRYRFFFDLFKDFKGYVDFFLLQDLTNQDCTAIDFFHPFEEFGKDILPENAEEYKLYMGRCIEFVDKRNRRILDSLQIT